MDTQKDGKSTRESALEDARKEAEAIRGKRRPKPRIIPLLFTTLISGAFITFIVFMTKAGKLPILIPIIFCFFSIITILAYAKDKHSAVKGNWRTRELTLQLLALIGGWPGALIAQQLFNHKHGKLSFVITYRAMVIFNCIALGWIFTKAGNTLACHWSERIMVFPKLLTDLADKLL